MHKQRFSLPFLTFIFLVAILGLSSNTSASEDSSKLSHCAQLVIPRLKISDPISFRRLNKASINQTELENKQYSLVETPAPLINRNQDCFGTCYLETSQAVVEVAAKLDGHLDPQDFMSSFAVMMTVARTRYLANPSRPVNLLDLLNAGSDDGYEAIAQNDLFYFDKAAIEQVGGRQRFHDLERALRDELYSTSVRTPEILRRFFAQDELSFIKHLQEIEENYIAKKTGGVVKAKPLHLRPIKFTKLGIFRTAGEDLKVRLKLYTSSSTFSVSLVRHSPNVRINDLNLFFNEMIDAINAGYVLDTSIKIRTSETLSHAILITGYLTNSKNELVGFKFQNSYGTKNAYAQGFISVDEFITNVHYVYIIDSVTPARQLPTLQDYEADLRHALGTLQPNRPKSEQE